MEENAPPFDCLTIVLTRFYAFCLTFDDICILCLQRMIYTHVIEYSGRLLLPQKDKNKNVCF